MKWHPFNDLAPLAALRSQTLGFLMRHDSAGVTLNAALGGEGNKSSMMTPKGKTMWAATGANVVVNTSAGRGENSCFNLSVSTYATCTMTRARAFDASRGRERFYRQAQRKGEFMDKILAGLLPNPLRLIKCREMQRSAEFRFRRCILIISSRFSQTA